MAVSRLNRSSPHQRRALAAEIAEALRCLGGAAHRDRVIEFVGAMRRCSGRPVDEQITLELAEAFDAYCDLGRRTGASGAMFTLPFGPSSHRWALLDTEWMHGASDLPQAAAG